MVKSVKLSDSLVFVAKNASKDADRTIKEQIEHWVKIGQLVEANPTLTYEFIKKSIKGD